MLTLVSSKKTFLGLTLMPNTEVTPEAFVDLVLNNQDHGQITIDDPNLIRRDLKNLRIHMKEKAHKTLRVTCKQKRFFYPGQPQGAPGGEDGTVVDSVPFGYKNTALD